MWYLGRDFGLKIYMADDQAVEMMHARCAKKEYEIVVLFEKGEKVLSRFKYSYF